MEISTTGMTQFDLSMLIALFCAGFCTVDGYVLGYPIHARKATTFAKARARQKTILALKDDEYSSPTRNDENSDDDDMRMLLRDLRDRTEALDHDAEIQSQQLRRAECHSGSLVLPDWVRRLDVDFPIVACGSASDTLYVAHMETGTILASTDGSSGTISPGDAPRHSSITDERVDHVLHQMYGKFDGGGTLSVVLQGNVLCASLRSGGVYVWRLQRENPQSDVEKEYPDSALSLVPQGWVPSLMDAIVTTMKFCDDYLWIGTDRGTVEAYATDHSSLPLTLRTQPELSYRVRGIVLAIDVHSHVGVAVAATDAGHVALLSLEEEEDDALKIVRKPIVSISPAFDGTERRSSNVYPTCATIVRGTPGAAKDTYSIACGANDGSIFLQSLSLDEHGEVDLEDPLKGQCIRSLMPKHFDAIRCMASPAPGLLLTGGIDGTLRLWDVDEPKLLYQFLGYKVWLGSLWTDGVRIVTDGADNTVIMHDFSLSKA